MNYNNNTSSEEEYLLEKGANKQRETQFYIRNVYKIFPKIVPCVPERYILALLLCSGLCVVYALRVNLSIALVEMVNHTVGVAPNFTYAVRCHLYFVFILLFNIENIVSKFFSAAHSYKECLIAWTICAT